MSETVGQALDRLGFGEIRKKDHDEAIRLALLTLEIERDHQELRAGNYRAEREAERDRAERAVAELADAHRENLAFVRTGEQIEALQREAAKLRASLIAAEGEAQGYMAAADAARSEFQAMQTTIGEMQDHAKAVARILKEGGSRFLAQAAIHLEAIYGSPAATFVVCLNDAHPHILTGGCEAPRPINPESIDSSPPPDMPVTHPPATPDGRTGTAEMDGDAVLDEDA